MPKASRKTRKTPPTKAVKTKTSKPKPRKPSTAGVSKTSYNPVAPERIREILRRLDERYPGATCALHHHNAWELLVATILSAQCTDATVNKVTPELFKKYPTPADFAALQPEQLEPQIRATGFFRNKSKSLVGAARGVMANFNGQVPDAMDQLLTLPGAKRPTSFSVPGFAKRAA